MDTSFLTGSKELRNKRIKKKSRTDIEPQEVFLDVLAKKKEKEFGFSEKKLETPLSRGSLFGLYVFFLILILLFLGKTFQFQIIQGKELVKKAEKNKFIIHSILATRGIIYDKNLESLVSNRPSFDLVVKKSELPKDEQRLQTVLKEVSLILSASVPLSAGLQADKKLETPNLENKIRQDNSQQILIAENLDHQSAVIFETKIADNELPGFKIENNNTREYKDGSIFSHLLGYTGKIRLDELKALFDYSITDYVGRDGLEKNYESTLRKTSGKIRIERDALGNEISREIISLPETGNNLVLWLDAGLQRKMKEELEAAIKNVGAKRGAAAALDPRTGGVLAMVSYPSYDNNLFSQGISKSDLQKLLEDPDKPLFNRVISGGYSTGSTIKPLIASAALQEKIISPDKKINDIGYIEVLNKYNPGQVYTYRGITPHGWVDMRKAIAVSSNIYFYTVGGGYKDQKGLGPTRIKKYLELFGWGSKTGVDLPGEADGFVPSPEWKKQTKKESWWDGDTYHFSIGQGDLSISPMQVVSAFAAIANGGTLYQPKIVQKIIDSDKNTVQELEPTILRKGFIDYQNLQIAREGMRDAVIYGSSSTLNNLPVKAAAKTGTAQTSKKNHYNYWVSTFAPYENPEIVMTIVLEDVKGLRQVVILPAARNVLNWYFSHAKKTETNIQENKNQEGSGALELE